MSGHQGRRRTRLIGRMRQDNVAVLIEHLGKRPDDAAVRLRLRQSCFLDRYPHAERIARPNRPEPAHLVDPGAGSPFSGK